MTFFIFLCYIVVMWISLFLLFSSVMLLGIFIMYMLNA